jgi:alpha/beta superfamily hydrolase
MNPFFFGRSARQLYGAYDPPATSARDQGVVLCPAIGDEYLFAHPTYRLLARQLADVGYHVLRFDYYGTGDSAGEFGEASQAQWIEDIEAAVNEIKDLGQVTQVGLVGLRYGAALAAQVARNRSDVDQLVLWDAVTDGRAFLEEIGAPATVPSAPVDACGVVITPAFRADIESTTPESFGPPLPKTLVMASDRMTTAAEGLARTLTSSHIDCVLEHSTDAPVWLERPTGAGTMAVRTVKGIVTWMR